MNSYPPLSPDNPNLAVYKEKLTDRFINSINTSIHPSMKKRNRPLSSYFDSPSEEIHNPLEDLENESPLTNRNIQKSKPTENEFNQIQQHPMNSKNLLRKFKPENSDSPLSNRKPFKNITNFVNNFEFPIKSKLSLSTKSFTKAVAKYSQPQFLEKDSYSQSHSYLEDTDVDEEDDINDTTINDELLQNIDNTDVDEADDSFEDLLDSPTQQSLSNKTSIQHMKFANKSFANFETNCPRGIRRIHSMYQTSKEKQTYNNIMPDDNSHLPKSSIRTFKVDNDLLPRIDDFEMYKILCGEYNNEFDEFIIIDCRFNYEFNGGHIDGAINISSQQHLEELLINSRPDVSKEPASRRKQLIIFHCEFSIFRGPTMASHLRKCDRILNRNNYPLLSYPDIVILEGGYKRFYDTYSHRCFPQGYIEMKDINYQEHCEFELDKVRQANKLTRAKSHNQFSLSNNNLASQHHNSFHATTAPFVHNRSSSYTTVTCHSENLKVLKRQRSSSKVQSSNQLSTNNLRSRSLSNFDLTSKYSRPSSLTHAPSIFNSPKQGHKISSSSSPKHGKFSSSSPKQGKFSSSSSPKLHRGHGFSSSASSLLADEDFQPPPALFRSTSTISNGSNDRPLLSTQFTEQSLSSVSITSARSSISSDPYSSAFSSSDSLSEFQSSPIGEYSEIFDFNHSKCSSAHTSYQSNLSNYSNYVKNSSVSFNEKPLTTSLLNPMIRKPMAPIPQIPTQKLSPSLKLPHIKNSGQYKSKSSNSIYTTNDKTVSSNKPKVIQVQGSFHSGFTFPSSTQSSSKAKASGLTRISTKTNVSLATSSPVVSSPLSTATPISTIESAFSNNPTSSLIDPINDAPVDFSVPINNTHSGQNLSNNTSIGGNYGIAKVYSNSNRYPGHSRKHSNSLFSSAGGGLYNYLSLDIDEADEEDDEVGALR